FYFSLPSLSLRTEQSPPLFPYTTLFRSLRIAQPALSQMIRALEADLDVDLFERTTRRVRLTPAGEALLEPAAAIGTQVDGARRIARAAQQGLAGRVRIGFGGTSGYSI